MTSKSGRDTISKQEELDHLGRLMDANSDPQRTRRPKEKNPIKNDSDEYSNAKKISIINPHPFELIKLPEDVSHEKRSNKSLKNSSKKSSKKSMTAGFGGANKNASKVRTATGNTKVRTATGNTKVRKATGNTKVRTATGNTKVRKAVVRSKSRI